MKRLAGSLVLAALAGSATVATADDQYLPPTTAAAPTAAPDAQAAPGAPAAQPASPSPYPTADRWVRRSQRMREASLNNTMPKPNDGSLPPLPPLDLAPTQQTGGQPDASFFVPPSNTPLPPPDAIAQRPLSPAQMPGGTQFREGSPEYGAPPAPEQIKKPSELPKVTQILPYADYEPDPKVARENPCENQCPMPDGKPCKTRDGRVLDCPKEITLSEGAWQPRIYPPSVYAWQASNISYNPLYYEDPQLERYGHSYPFFIQPAVSIGRFVVQAAGWPYQAVIDPPHCEVYPLGFYRPGECSPKLIYQIPLNLEAGLVEAGAIAGTYFLFPHSAWAYSSPGQK
jgi:hypothetical protein